MIIAGIALVLFAAMAAARPLSKQYPDLFPGRQRD